MTPDEQLNELVSQKTRASTAIEASHHFWRRVFIGLAAISQCRNPHDSGLGTWPNIPPIRSSLLRSYICGTGGTRYRASRVRQAHVLFGELETKLDIEAQRVAINPDITHWDSS
jgi:hypothetical protein